MNTQKQCESYVTDYTTELNTMETRLDTVEKIMNDCYEQFNANIQQFTEAHLELDEQITPATNLQTHTQTLRPLERIKIELVPKMDTVATKKKMLVVINQPTSLVEPSNKSKANSANSPALSNHAKVIGNEANASISTRVSPKKATHIPIRNYTNKKLTAVTQGMM